MREGRRDVTMGFCTFTVNRTVPDAMVSFKSNTDGRGPVFGQGQGRAQPGQNARLRISVDENFLTFRFPIQGHVAETGSRMGENKRVGPV